MDVQVLGINAGSSVKFRIPPNIPCTLDTIKQYLRYEHPEFDVDCTFFMGKAVVRRGVRLIPQDGKTITIISLNKSKCPEKSFPRADCAFDDYLRFTETAQMQMQGNTAVSSTEIYHRYSSIHNMVDDIASQLHGQSDPNAVRIGSLEDYRRSTNSRIPERSREPEEEEDTDDETSRRSAPSQPSMIEEAAERFRYSEDEEIVHTRRVLSAMGFTDDFAVAFLVFCNGNTERLLEMITSILSTSGYVPEDAEEEEEEENEEEEEPDLRFRYYYF